MIKKNIDKLFFPHDEKPNHFKALDGLRGIAVIIVLLSHSSHENVFISNFLNFDFMGKVGVYLFFVLSAYLLDRQIALALMNNKVDKEYWKNYFFRRFLRIYPLFVVALIIYGMVNLFWAETVIDKLTDVVLHLILLRGESVFWSIPVEFKYYIISPIIMLICHKYFKWKKVKLLLLLISLIVLSVIVEYLFNLPLLSTFRYLPIFLLGTIISIFEVLKKENRPPNISSRVIDSLGLLSLSLIILTNPYFFESVFGQKIDVQNSLLFLPYAILWGVILLSVKYSRGILKKILEFKFLRLVGNISFSMYLFHMLFLNLVLDFKISSQYKFLVFFMVSFLFSMGTYLLIERPLSKISLNTFRAYISKFYVRYS